MSVELLQDSVYYQAKTKLLELAVLISETKNSKLWEPWIIQGAKIHRLLQGLDYSDYLTKAQRDRIVRTLVEVAEINDFSVAPVLGNIEPPSIVVGVRGATGEQGETGPEGGGVPFSATAVTTDTVVDSFPYTDARGVEYTINIYDDSGSDMRVMRLQAGWSSDGSVYADDGGIGTTIQGDTSPVTMSVIVSGTTVQLFATVTSGTWEISGTRKYVPNNGNGIVNPTTLASGKLWIGNASNNPVAVTVSGDFTISTTGVGAIASGSIVNSDVSGTAAIAVSKLASMSASKAVVTDSSGFLTTSAATAAEVGFLSGVSSPLQDQLDSKVDSASGAISTVTSTDLTSSRALIANALGKIAVSAVTDTELAVLDGITATTAELNFCDGVTSSIQTQFSNKVSGSGLNIAVVSIGSWDMNFSSTGANTKLVAHNIADHTKIRSVTAMIRDDSNNWRPIDRITSVNSATYAGSVLGWDATNVSLGAVIGGAYDSTSYNDTASTRGYITIIYTD